jgi:hypothetical protein
MGKPEQQKTTNHPGGKASWQNYAGELFLQGF